MPKPACFIALILCVEIFAIVPAFPDAGGESPSRHMATLIARLESLDTAGYTGGLSRRNRALAQEIRTAMKPRFPPVSCKGPFQISGVLVDPPPSIHCSHDPSTEGMDPDLATLVKLLAHERQEVRDTAAYTIGLLGRSGADAVPFLSRAFCRSFAAHPSKGNWTNDAYGKVTCTSIVPPSFLQVLPDHLLPPQKPRKQFLARSAILMAQLYLDEDVEYPPGMMRMAYVKLKCPWYRKCGPYAPGRFSVTWVAGPAAPLLGKILENDNLSTQKHIEAAQALTYMKRRDIRIALSGLLRHAESSNQELRTYVVEALARLKHK